MFEKLLRSLRILYVTQIYSWKIGFAYRTQAAIWLLYFIAQSFLSFAFVTVIYGVSSGIQGWTYAQMLMLSSTTVMLMGIIYYLIDIPNITQSLLQGEMDTTLTKPITPFMAMISNVNGGVTPISSVITGAALFAYGAHIANISLAQVLIFILLFLLGTMVAIVFTLVLITSSYKFFRGGNWISWLTNNLSNATKYPLNIYGALGGIVFTFLIPFGFATYYPIEVITGKVSGSFVIIFIVASIGIIAGLYLLFNHLFKNYSSGMG